MHFITKSDKKRIINCEGADERLGEHGVVKGREQAAGAVQGVQALIMAQPTPPEIVPA